jgi:hypothetical protein
MTCSGTATPPTGTNTLNKLSGTGDANIVYTSRTITGVPILGTTSTDSWRYQRDQSNGRYMIVEGYIKGTAAGTAGSGAYVFQIPGSSVAGAGGPTVDTTQVTIAASFPTAAAPGGTGTALETTGFYAVSALTSINNIGGMMIAFPYSPSQVYFDCLYVVNAFSTAQNGWSPWSSSINPFSSNPINVRVRYKVPITGWLP